MTDFVTPDGGAVTGQPSSLFPSLRRAVRYWLIDHSSLYRRWIRWRTRRAFARLERTLGKRLMPALMDTAAAMSEWLRGVERGR